MSSYIWIGKKKVPVSDEIYREYYRMARRQRYLEEDVKVGRIKVNGGEVKFIDSKEDSLHRLMDLGADFADEQMVEDILCDKAEMLILQEAMAALEQDEQELIQAIYFKEQSTREIAKEENVSQPAIVKRHKKILNKLKNYFKKNGYQNPF